MLSSRDMQGLVTAKYMRLTRSCRDDGGGYICIAHVSCSSTSIAPPPVGNTKLLGLNDSTMLSLPRSTEAPGGYHVACSPYPLPLLLDRYMGMYQCVLYRYLRVQYSHPDSRLSDCASDVESAHGTYAFSRPPFGNRLTTRFVS